MTEKSALPLYSYSNFHSHSWCYTESIPWVFVNRMNWNLKWAKQCDFKSNIAICKGDTGNFLTNYTIAYCHLNCMQSKTHLHTNENKKKEFNYIYVCICTTIYYSMIEFLSNSNMIAYLLLYVRLQSAFAGVRMHVKHSTKLRTNIMWIIMLSVAIMRWWHRKITV